MALAYAKAQPYKVGFTAISIGLTPAFETGWMTTALLQAVSFEIDRLITPPPTTKQASLSFHYDSESVQATQDSLFTQKQLFDHPTLRKIAWVLPSSSLCERLPGKICPTRNSDPNRQRRSSKCPGQGSRRPPAL